MRAPEASTEGANRLNNNDFRVNGRFLRTPSDFFLTPY